MARELPKVGTAVYIRKDGKVLLGQRNSDRGDLTWCVPGGHLEMFETLEECVHRETMEEANIEIENVSFLQFIEDPHQGDGKHYITFSFVADWKSGQVVPQPAEFHKWEWFEWSKLPEPLFRPTKLFVESGTNPFELD